MLFAEGLQALLRDEFELLGTVANGKELVEATHRLNRVILVDISMPVLNGFDAVRRIRKDGNSAKVIFLTMHDDETLSRRSVSLRRIGLCPKAGGGRGIGNGDSRSRTGQQLFNAAGYQQARRASCKWYIRADAHSAAARSPEVDPVKG